MVPSYSFGGRPNSRNAESMVLVEASAAQFPTPPGLPSTAHRWSPDMGIHGIQDRKLCHGAMTAESRIQSAPWISFPHHGPSSYITPTALLGPARYSQALGRQCGIDAASRHAWSASNIPVLRR